MSDNYDEYYDPLHVNDGKSSRLSPNEEGRKDKDQLMSEIDYDRVKEDIEKLYIPEHVVSEMLDDYKTVTVRDFNDIYHKSEEEREEENKFYHLFAVLNNMSHRENNIESFIIRSRLTIDILREIAENNGILSPKKFIKDYFKEKIVITGLPVPKLRGKLRKKYSMSYLMDFIMSGDDPALFAPKKKEFDDHEYELEELLPQEVVEAVKHAKDDPVSSRMYFDDPDDQDGRNVALIYSRKAAKDIGKDIPALLDTASVLRKINKKRSKTYSSLDSMRFVGDVRDDDFDRIEAYDQTIYENPDRIKEPKMPKDMSDQDAVNAYLAAMELYYERTTYVDNHAGGTCTLEEFDETNIKDALARNGFDIRAMYGYKEQKKKLKKIRKKEAKKEEELKQRLLRLQNRRKDRMDGNSGKRRLSDKEKKKKKKKDKKKSKNLIEDSFGVTIDKSIEDSVYDFEWGK